MDTDNECHALVPSLPSSRKELTGQFLILCLVDVITLDLAIEQKERVVERMRNVTQDQAQELANTMRIRRPSSKYYYRWQADPVDLSFRRINPQGD